MAPWKRAGHHSFRHRAGQSIGRVQRVHESSPPEVCNGRANALGGPVAAVLDLDRGTLNGNLTEATATRPANYCVTGRRSKQLNSADSSALVGPSCSNLQPWKRINPTAVQMVPQWNTNQK